MIRGVTDTKQEGTRQCTPAVSEIANAEPHRHHPAARRDHAAMNTLDKLADVAITDMTRTYLVGRAWVEPTTYGLAILRS
jgi:hypothetical protein